MFRKIVSPKTMIIIVLAALGAAGVTAFVSGVLLFDRNHHETHWYPNRRR